MYTVINQANTYEGKSVGEKEPALETSTERKWSLMKFKHKWQKKRENN